MRFAYCANAHSSHKKRRNEWAPRYRKVRRGSCHKFRGLTMDDKPQFPGGSKNRVTRAGNAVRKGAPTAEDLRVIDIWREAHRHVLNTFQAILRNRTRQTHVVVAQRHKRKKTIFGKLNRYITMDLARMDD